MEKLMMIWDEMDDWAAVLLAMMFTRHRSAARDVQLSVT
jgi:hypothetical protein